ncbi:pleckstrin homology domain-containing family M member 1 [Astyanax mexicanus]|uniref:Pleckstrin homology domain-containing family M member 1 n=1 Tax=Astyanax mexicanus TaxID=7994 RepID=A0A8T2L840_ASTMX|nr:pleckstrin homology domain-containing family M member 1 [Astyanax mexicanus]
MLATQTADSVPEAKNAKQWIKEKIAQTLKALQKRYVTTDAAVTSEDLEANQLCCALEAVFIHGLRSKHIRTDGAGARGRKGPALPQPVFWSLLKSVTHRDVILELEGLSFINTDVGRCRAWVRLALNDGLLECYLMSLLREDTKLSVYYQPGALLLDPEDREVLLSLLQGLASLAFTLSYKSAVLNEWTTTPLALAGLCPASAADDFQLPSRRKESWDTASQSSGGSSSGGSANSDGAPEVIHRGLSKGINGAGGVRTPLTASDLSLDTAGSSQLSSSLGSDGPLQAQEQRGLERESWSSHTELSHEEQHKSTLRKGSSSSSQDLTKEDVDMVSPPSDSTNTTHSSSDEDSPRPSSPNKQHTPPPPPPLSADTSGPDTPSTVPEEEITAEIPSKPEPEPAVVTRPAATEHSVQQESQSKPSVSSTPAVPTSTISNSVTPRNPPVASGALRPEENPGRSSAQRSCSVVSRKTSSGSLFNSPSWISEEDFYKPDPYGSGDSEGPDVSDVTQMNGTVSPASPEPASHQSPPCVVHRRQIGLSNPFRGLLKLGQLERRVTLGMWKDFYCELSPFELRLYTDAEERSCCENCSLLRCEDVRLSSAAEGRFRLSFPGKKLELRAPSRGEAEDWVDRIVEAVNKARPAARDEHWEVLQASPVLGDCPGDRDNSSLSSTPSSPEREPAEPPETDWTRPADPEPDAIKEAVVCLGQEERGWRSLVLSLSLEALRGFSVQEGRKMPVFSHPIEAVRDVVPDAALGGPAFFKVLMGKETLTVRAESGEEARTWRSLIRGALDSYLETQDDGMAEEVMSPGGGQGGNINRLVQHRLKGDGVLLPYLTTVPTERGLDAQSFKCAGCPRQVGVSLGRARLCEFSGQYYCEGCHHGDTTIIPSRMVHNWDLTPREVSGPALKLLANIKQEPLLNLDLLNPDLFNHTEVMAAVQCLRQKLRLLGDYLLICRSGVRKKIEARLNQRMYLLESSSLYSVLDLKEIADGQYEGFLQSQIQFSSSHVHHCDLCTQRGFICQICNTDDIIFPFQFETTTRCTVCKTVFHSSCKAQNLSCPRCERRQRYHERVLLR